MWRCLRIYSKIYTHTRCIRYLDLHVQIYVHTHIQENANPRTHAHTYLFVVMRIFILGHRFFCEHMSQYVHVWRFFFVQCVYIINRSKKICSSPCTFSLLCYIVDIYIYIYMYTYVLYKIFNESAWKHPGVQNILMTAEPV